MAIWETVYLKGCSESYNVDLKLESYQGRSQRNELLCSQSLFDCWFEITLDWMLNIGIVG